MKEWTKIKEKIQNKTDKESVNKRKKEVKGIEKMNERNEEN